MIDLKQCFKSMADNDDTEIVMCDLDSTIIYMNKPAAKKFEKRGGFDLVGKNLLKCHAPKTQDKIGKILEWFKQDKENNIVHTVYLEDQMRDTYIIALRDEEGNLIAYYEKYEYRKRDESPYYEHIDN